MVAGIFKYLSPPDPIDPVIHARGIIPPAQKSTINMSYVR